MFLLWLCQDPKEAGGKGADPGPLWRQLPTLDAEVAERCFGARHGGDRLEADGERQGVEVLP